ncbi:hypothetical protein Hanom_Chr15g01389871 [Helianthus anomalus]
MLDWALAYRRAFAWLALADSNLKNFPPEEEERTKEEIITRLLKLFYDITTIFSRNSYPTSNLT